MSVPKLRFKNFSQALINGPFEHYIKSSKYGPRFDANDYDLNGNVKTIRGTDVALDATIKYEQVPIANLPQKLIDEHQLHEGDILMITTADCGLSAVFEKQEIPFIASAYAVRIVLKNSLDSLWVKYYLQTQHIVNEVNKYVRKGTLSNLPLSDISKFSFTVPALEEQTKIATFLSAVDEKISQLTQKHELLSQYKQGMMQKLFSQQIRFKADDGSEFGEWEERKLGEVCRFVNGRAYKQTEWEKEGTPVIRLQNLTGSGKEYYYSNLNLPDHQYCYNNDLLYMWSATFGPVFWQGEKAIFHYHIWKIEVNPQLLDKKYMYFLLDEMTEKMKRSLNGSTMLHVTKQGMENTEKIIPSLPEQTKIANFLSSVDQKIEVVAQQIEQAKQWKKGLLQQMFV